jgi:serine protease Do
MSDLDSAVRTELDYEGTEGSAVFVVEPGSPAELAGLKVKDIVLKYNGSSIISTEQLISLVQQTKIGTTATMQVWREGKTIELETTIIEAKPPVQSPEGSPLLEDVRKDSEVLDEVGIKVRSLSKAELVQGFQGVFVVETLPDGVAQDVLFPGDLIIAMNNLAISDSKEFYMHLAASAAVQVTSFHLIRNGQPMRVNIPAPQ